MQYTPKIVVPITPRICVCLTKFLGSSSLHTKFCLNFHTGASEGRVDWYWTTPVTVTEKADDLIVTENDEHDDVNHYFHCNVQSHQQQVPTIALRPLSASIEFQTLKDDNGSSDDE